MDTIKKGDPITADWANALTNAINAVTHGSTALRGGSQDSAVSPYGRASRPLAFDLITITDDDDSSINGTIAGGKLYFSTKTDPSENSTGEEAELKLTTGQINIADLVDTFSSGEKVYVKVSYQETDWKPLTAVLEKSSEVPESELGITYFPVGEFKLKNNLIVYRHYGVTSIKWDPIKWGAGVGPGLGLEWQTEKTDGCEDGLKWMKIKLESKTVDSSTQQDPIKCQIDLTVSPNGLRGDLKVEDRWTILGCDSDHAIRLRVDSTTGKLYIQLGAWETTSSTYEPVDETTSQQNENTENGNTEDEE